MNFLLSRHAPYLGCALVLVAAATSHAQNAGRIASAPQPSAPAAAATFGLPKPGGLTSRFPAGLPETGVIGNTGTAAPTTNGTTTGVDVTGTAGATGTGLNAAGVVYAGPVAPQGPVSGPAGTYSAVQIAASFIGADANRDGELTRAEFQHLTIKPYTFEEMDRDHDGVVTRFEYEDAVH